MIDQPDHALTPIDAQPIVINPKVDEEPVPLRCPDCDSVIRGVEGSGVEYRCDCDSLRRFEIVVEE